MTPSQGLLKYCDENPFKVGQSVVLPSGETDTIEYFFSRGLKTIASLKNNGDWHISSLEAQDSQNGQKTGRSRHCAIAPMGLAAALCANLES